MVQQANLIERNQFVDNLSELRIFSSSPNFCTPLVLAEVNEVLQLNTPAVAL